MKKKIKSNLYVQGKFGNWLYREVLNKDSPYLYEEGKRKSKIEEEDLPEEYIKVHSKTLRYTNGWINTKGIKYVYCRSFLMNHYRKDDTLYISYDKPLKLDTIGWFTDVLNYDYLFCGSCINDILDYIEIFSPECDTSQARKELRKKDAYLKKNHPELLPKNRRYVSRRL